MMKASISPAASIREQPAPVQIAIFLIGLPASAYLTVVPSFFAMLSASSFAVVFSTVPRRRIGFSARITLMPRSSARESFVPPSADGGEDNFAKCLYFLPKCRKKY